MAQKSNISSLLNIFTVLLACHLLNFSIDSKDLHPNHISEDLTHNDIESILEFTVEVLLGFDNAFFEYDEADEEEGRQIGFYLFCSQLLPLYNVLFGPPVVAIYGRAKMLDYIGNHLFIQSPPPESPLRAA